MQTQPYSLTRRDDGIYIIFMPDNKRETIEHHFETLAGIIQNHPPDTPMYTLVDISSGQKLPSIRYLVDKIRTFYRQHPPPEYFYVAYVYPRDDVMFAMFTQLLRSMRMNSPRRFFKTDAAATAWLMNKQAEHENSPQENSQFVD